MRRAVALALALLLCGPAPALALTPGSRVVLLSKPSAGPIITQTATLVAAMTTPPTPNRLRVINNTMTQLVQSGLLPLMDFLYIFGAQTQQAATLNWASPGSFAITISGSCTFTADFGFTSDGTTCKLVTGYVPNTNGVNWTQNSTSVGVWCLQSTAANASPLLGQSTASTLVQVIPRASGSGMGVRVNDGTNSTTGTQAASNGMTIAVRDGASTREFYWNGTQVGTDAIASTGRSTGTIWGLANNTTFAPTTRPIALMFGGAALTAAQVATLTQILSNYIRSAQGS